MIFALDFDDTFTRDPVLFLSFVRLARSRGHTVYCVTMRNDDELDDVRDTLGLFVDAIINTSRQYKCAFLANRSIKIDVWIDDNPLFIIGPT